MDRPPMGRHHHHVESKKTLEELSVTNWLTPENAVFSMENGLLYCRISDGKNERVKLARAFPFELLWEYISVLDQDGEELGLIRTLDSFEGEENELLRSELKKRYYSPIITGIRSVKERYGFSYWKVDTKEGEVSFTLHDTYRSIIHIGEKSLLFLDVDGNRFELPDTDALDRRSHRRIELYL